MKEGLFSLGRGPHKCRLVVGMRHSHCELLLQIMPSVCHGILKRHGLVQHCCQIHPRCKNCPWEKAELCYPHLYPFLICKALVKIFPIKIHLFHRQIHFVFQLCFTPVFLATAAKFAISARGNWLVKKYVLCSRLASICISLEKDIKNDALDF